MQTIMINGQDVSVESIVTDVQEAMKNGFTGYGDFNAQTIISMLNLLSSDTVVDKSVPVDYEMPNWKSKNRLYDWRNYITESFQDNWMKFSHVQKVILAKEAHGKAMMESWE
jgi:hypothetical protein